MARKVEERNKCDGCTQRGLCCCHSIVESGTLYILPTLRCEYLDENNNCIIFDNRHKIFPGCASMAELGELGGVPPKCNYRDDYDFPYKKVKIASPQNEKRLIKKLRKQLGVPSTQ